MPVITRPVDVCNTCIMSNRSILVTTYTKIIGDSDG